LQSLETRMNQAQLEPGLFSGLSRIPEALRNERALFALLVTHLLSAALAFLGYTLLNEPMIMVALFVLLGLLVLPIGSSVAGLLLMDQACGQEPRSLDRAVIDGINVFPRMIGLALFSIAMTVVLCLAVGLALFLCKLPFIGPALYAVLFPILVILSGLAFFGLMAGLAMTGPAIWSGASVRDAISLVWRIACTRLPELLTGLLLLAALVFMVECVLGSILLVGHSLVQGAATLILGSELQKEYLFGAMIGLALILSAVMAMSMMGLNLLFLRLTKGIPAVARPQEAAPPPRERVVVPLQEKREPTIQPLPSGNGNPYDRTRSAPTPHFPATPHRAATSNGERATPAHSAPTVMMKQSVSPNSLLNGASHHVPPPAPPTMQSAPETVPPWNAPPPAPPTRPAFAPAPETVPPWNAPPQSSHTPHSAPTVMVSRSVPGGPLNSGGQDELLEQFLAARQFSAKEKESERESAPPPRYEPPPPRYETPPPPPSPAHYEAPPPPRREPPPLRYNPPPPTPERDDGPEAHARPPEANPSVMMIACPRCQTAAHSNDCFCSACGARLHGWK
jgi:hypothetical protein